MTERLKVAMIGIDLRGSEDLPDGPVAILTGSLEALRCVGALYGEDVTLSRAGAALQWQPIETAPFDEVVRVKAGEMTFLAALRPDASIDQDDETCAQWQAENEGEHPPCWSGGACWGSNEDGIPSLQPTAWQPK